MRGNAGRCRTQQLQAHGRPRRRLEPKAGRADGESETDQNRLAENSLEHPPKSI